MPVGCIHMYEDNQIQVYTKPRTKAKNVSLLASLQENTTHLRIGLQQQIIWVILMYQLNPYFVTLLVTY